MYARYGNMCHVSAESLTGADYDILLEAGHELSECASKGCPACMLSHADCEHQSLRLPEMV